MNITYYSLKSGCNVTVELQPETIKEAEDRFNNLSPEMKSSIETPLNLLTQILSFNY